MTLVVTVGLLAVTMVVAAGASVVGLRRRRDPAGAWFAALCLSLAFWAGFDVASVWAQNDTLQRLLVGSGMIAATATIVSLAWWTAIVTGWHRVLGTPLLALIVLPGLVPAAVMAVGNPNNMVMAITPTGHIEAPRVDLAVLGLLNVTWAYVISLVAASALLVLALAMPKRSRRWMFLIVFALFVPLILNVLTETEVIDLGGADVTSVGGGIALLALLLGVPRLGILDLAIGLLPVARDEVVEAMSEGVVVLDPRNRILDINPAGAQILDYPLPSATVADVTEILPGWGTRDPASPTWEFTVPGSDPPRVIEARAEPLKSARAGAGTLVLLRDITRQCNAQAALERSVAQHVHASRHDPLTGLPNRVLLFSELRAALSATGEGCALFILDLNGFKGLNDTFGHRSGDRILRDLGARLENAVGPGVIAARLGGDEFAVMTTAPDPGMVSGTAERILGAFQLPFRVADTDVLLGASVGAAVGPKDGQDADDLVHAADVAMYHAKRTSRRWAMYEPGLDARRPEQLMLRHELRRALEADELVIYYQPLAATDGGVGAVEALVRWQHPQRGLLMPDQFLPVIEDSDLICRLTDVVLDKAVAQIKRWTGRDMRVAVNLSALDLRDPRLPARVSRVLEHHGVGPSALTLEITENALSGTRESAAQLDHLRQNGVRVALDDFGTGIGPLSTLRELSVDAIKIDRSFVSAMVANPRDTALVGGLIRLGHDLGLAVVAEGVESDDERRLLTTLGCDLLQGYLIGRPLPPQNEPPGNGGGPRR